MRLNTTTNQVKRLVRDGKLKFINVGLGKIKPRYRFAEADIDDFEQQQRVRQEPLCQYSNQQSRRRILVRFPDVGASVSWLYAMQKSQRSRGGRTAGTRTGKGNHKSVEDQRSLISD